MTIDVGSKLDDDNVELFSLFECLTSLALALGPMLGERALPLVQRAQAIAKAVVIDVHA